MAGVGVGGKGIVMGGADKVMYAGYYPGLSYDRLQADLGESPPREHVWPKFLRENAIRVFKLNQDR